MLIQRLPSGAARVAPKSRTILVRRRAAMITGVQAGRLGEPFPGRGLSFGGILRGAGSIVTGLLTGGPLGAVTAGVNRMIPQPNPPSTGPCPEGFVLGDDGSCRVAGIRGAIERFLPGGATGMLPRDQFGSAVIGAFGMPALQPAQVGTIRRTDGSTGPILRCPAGMVLGKDNLCYPTQVLGARGRFRKNPRAPRPPVTAADAKAIRQAESARKRVGRLAKAVGACPTPKRRKK